MGTTLLDVQGFSTLFGTGCSSRDIFDERGTCILHQLTRRERVMSEKHFVFAVRARPTENKDIVIAKLNFHERRWLDFSLVAAIHDSAIA